MSSGPQPAPERSKSKFCFGEFELDRDTAALYRKGREVRLQSQPARVLLLLVAQAGEVVTREEIRRTLWPDDTFVEFDAIMGNIVRKIRIALADDADNPRFLQTVPKQGFRFVAPVHYAIAAPVGPVELERPESPAALHAPPAVAAIPAPSASKARRGWAVGGVVVLLGLAVWLGSSLPGILDPFAGSSAEALLTQTQPFIAMAGLVEHPSFSPDGNTVAFNWNGGTNHPSNIWVQSVSAHSPTRLTDDAAQEYGPAWSPDGSEVAFIRRTEGHASIYSVSVTGKGERKRGEFTRSNLGRSRVSWSGDGKFFAVAERMANDAPSHILLISAQTGVGRQLTFPPAGSLGDAEPAFSPDSKSVAFRRTTANSVEDLFVVAVTGGDTRQITFDHVGQPGLAWSADGRSIIFSSHRAGALSSLWRVPVKGGRTLRLTPALVDASGPAVARRGDRLAFSSTVFDVNIWELKPSEKAEPRALINSTVLDSGPRFSADGQKIAFRSARSGFDEVWIVNADGGGARQLTNVGGALTGSPRWSPDGASVLFESRLNGNGDIFAIPSDGGKATCLTGGQTNQILPAWSHDGKWFYFASDRGRSWQIWRQPIGGGAAVQVTTKGGFASAESPDGKWLYYSKGAGVDGLWRMPLDPAGGPESLVLEAVTGPMWGNWAVAESGIYYIAFRTAPERSKIMYYEFAGKTTRELGELRGPAAVNDAGLAVSPDESRLLFAQVDRYESDIFLVNGFR